MISSACLGVAFHHGNDAFTGLLQGNWSNRTLVYLLFVSVAIKDGLHTAKLVRFHVRCCAGNICRWSIKEIDRKSTMRKCYI